MKSVFDLAAHFALATIVLLSGRMSLAQQTPPKTFVIAVSLLKTEMHASDDLVVLEATSNPTYHTVFVGNGPGVGYTLELLNGKGQDIGLCAMGGTQPHKENGIVLGSSALSLGPGTSTRFKWWFKPEPGCMSPGVYKLRMHDRDTRSKLEVYSNAVTLTVVP